MNAGKLKGWLPGLRAAVAQLGPYALIELVLPGGSLIAALLWLYRHRDGHQLRVLLKPSSR